MKNTLLRKMILPVVVLFLIISMIAPNVFLFTAHAVSANETPEEAVKNAEYEALKMQLTLEDELNRWAKERQEEREKAEIKELNKKTFKMLENTLNIANKNVPSLISTINDALNGDDFDTASCVSNVADLTSGILACAVPWGTVASVGIDFAETIFSTIMGGESGPDASALMEDRLNQRLDEIADQISEVQDQLTEISDEINQSTDKIISSVSTAIENEADKNHLRDFMLSSGKDDFSYNQLKNYIYGKTTDNRNATTAYYGLLMDAQLHGGSSEEIKHYYDLLYSSLMDNRTSFHDYITGDGFGKSIVATYYDVLSSRPDLTAELGMSAEMATIEFAYDLYQTELLMDQIILACNNYQYTQMVINNADEYNYGTGKVLKSEILNENEESLIANELTVGIDDLREQFAKDIVYILDITGSYIVEKDGDYYYQKTHMVDGVLCAYVLVDQTVFLNVIPVAVCEQFDLQRAAFDYSGRGVQYADGIVKVTYENRNSTINYKYTDTDGREYSLGAIKLVEASNATFSGGDGTADSPYLISSAEQFMNIADGLDKHYRLVNDIIFDNKTMIPFGYKVNSVGTETYTEFTGVLDGNGHTIGGRAANGMMEGTKLTINATSHSGIFAKIGEGGVVKNLNVSNVNIDVNISIVGVSSMTFTGGIIAGTNNGKIESCTVSDCKLIAKSNTTNEGAARSVFFKYGGITGTNNGRINVVRVENTEVDVNATHDFGGADTGSNRNNVFVGGICGTSTGTVKYAGVENDVVLNAFAKSVLNPKSTVNPYVKAIVGGITTNEGLDIASISDVYSLIPEENVTANRELKVESSWGEHYKNAKADSAPLIPGISEENKTKITTTANVVHDQFFEKEEYEVTITDKTEEYPVGAIELNEENLEIKVNSKVVDYFEILDVYGFNTYNENFNTNEEIEVLMLLYAEFNGKGVVLTGTFTITVAKNVVTAIEVINYDTTYFKGEKVQTVVTLNREDANGKTIQLSKTEVAVKDADTATAEIGKKTLELSYGGATCEVEIDVLCNVHYSSFDYKNTEHYTFVESVSATCQHGGYDVYQCTCCGEKLQTNRIGASAKHSIVREVSKEPTCVESGVIGKIYCAWCGEVYQEEVVLPQSPHEIGNVGNALNHKCTKCGEEYGHEFVVTESLVDGKVTYTYSCSCGYVNDEQDTNIITNTERLRPTVLVSNGYAQYPGDEVIVYVDLANDPGVIGANFGIRYDERLVLVGWYEGSFFKDSQVATPYAVSGGYNFNWANVASREAADGNMLKLVFRLPDDATPQDEYVVSVVYATVPGSMGGFSLHENVYASWELPAEPVKFITKDGYVRIVDRLPGDVNNDGIVNLMDALYLSNCLVNKDEYPVTNEIKQYGDVNLSGVVDNLDVVKLLQSLSGGYGANLLAPEFKIELNTNGYTEYQPKPLFIQLFGENNTYAMLAEIEQYMQQREGYKFLGWYTRLEGGERINNYDALVKYDANQKIQMLYARWERNSVFFDMNGATSSQIEKETYLGNGEQWIVLEEPEEKYAIKFADKDNSSNQITNYLYRTFSHWAAKINGVTYQYKAGEKFPIHMVNMGEITLVAHWGEWQLDVPALEKEGYHSEHIDWYASNQDIIDVQSQNGREDIKKRALKQDNALTLYADWTKPITYSVKYDPNGGSGEMENSVHEYGTSSGLKNNSFKKEYTVTFNFGWNGQDSDEKVVTHNPLSGWLDEYGKVVTDAYNWTAEEGAVITVFARWDEQTVTLSVPNARPGYTFAGWYTNPSFEDEYFIPGSKELTRYTVTGECTLYAKWTGNPYTIIYDGNKPQQASDNVTNVPGNTATANGQDVTLGSKPLLAGWSFQGWYDEDGNLIGKPGETLKAAELTTSSNITLYAKWTANTYKVILDANGGNASTQIRTYTYDTSVKLPADSSTRENCTFLGWSTSSTALTPIYNDGEFSKNHAESGTVTLYAIWVKTSAVVGYYSRDITIGSHSEAYYPGFNRQALLEAGYTKLDLVITIHGDAWSGWKPNNSPLVRIYSHEDNLLLQKGLDRFRNADGWSTREIKHKISIRDDVQSDGSFWISYTNEGVNDWILGTVEIRITAIKE